MHRKGTYMSTILKGAPVVAAMNEANAARCAALREKGVVPTLAVVRVGERPDDLSYEKGVMARCAKVGVEVKQFLLPADASQEELLRVIAGINADAAIHGCLLFRPLPKQFDDRTIRAALSPEKDIDGMKATAVLKAADRNPYSWNMEFYEYPDGSGYEGRFTKCGICVLMKELGLYDLAPALCHLDYTMSEAGGVTNFVRQYTLASGGPYCDCGYKKKGYRKTISRLPRSAEQEPHAQQERKEDQVG